MQLPFAHIADVYLITGTCSSCPIYGIPELSRFGAAHIVPELKIAMSSIVNNYLSFVKNVNLILKEWEVRICHSALIHLDLDSSYLAAESYFSSPQCY